MSKVQEAACSHRQIPLSSKIVKANLKDQTDLYHLGFLDYCLHLYCYFHKVSANMSSGFLQVFVELGNFDRTTSFIKSTGVACSDSVSHNLVQVLSIPVLLTQLGSNVAGCSNQFAFIPVLRIFKSTRSVQKPLAKQSVRRRLWSFHWSYLPNPSARAGYDTRSIFLSGVYFFRTCRKHITLCFLWGSQFYQSAWFLIGAC